MNTSTSFSVIGVHVALHALVDSVACNHALENINFLRYVWNLSHSFMTMYLIFVLDSDMIRFKHFVFHIRAVFMLELIRIRTVNNVYMKQIQLLLKALKVVVQLHHGPVVSNNIRLDGRCIFVDGVRARPGSVHQLDLKSNMYRILFKTESPTVQVKVVDLFVF